MFDAVATSVSWVVMAGLVGVTVILLREVRLLARRRREMTRRIELLERAALEARRRETVADVGRRLREAGAEPRHALRCRAQGLEDCYLWELFDGKLDGRFVEAGAADGVRNSVTWLLEAAGWTGVLVEADPDTAAQCAVNRPGCSTAHAALGPPGAPETTAFTRIGGGPDADHLSFAPDLARSASVYAAKARQRERIVVPVRTLTDILAEAPGAGADWDALVLDVEGAELGALQGLDLERFRFAVLMIEDLTGGADAEIEGLLAPAGYQRAGRIERNTVFIRRDRADLIGRAEALGWWPSEDRPGR